MPWIECKVTRAGPAEDGAVYIGLQATDKSFHRWYTAAPVVQREMLATALTAISTGNRVSVHLDDTTAYSTINRIYVTA